MEETLLGIGEFARLSGIPRKTLIFYDETGIFSPASIGANRYRLYSRRQLQTANVIVALRGIDVPLSEIRSFLDARSPEALIALCREQGECIARAMRKLEETREIIVSLDAAMQSTAKAKPGRIVIRSFPEARLFMGPPVESSTLPAIDDALIEFYESCARAGVPQTHPLGSITSLSGAGPKNRFRPERFYRPAGAGVPDELVTIRAAGRYLVGCGYGDYGELDGLYQKILRHSRRNGLTLAGDAYEEYLLNELALHNPDAYLAQVIVRIAGEG